MAHKSTRVVGARKVHACRRHDPYHFNRFARFDVALAPLTNAHVIAAVALRAGGVVLGVLKMLTEGISVRPKVFRQRFIDDRDSQSLALRSFAGGESAATKDRQTDSGEIIRADAPREREMVAQTTMCDP